MANRNTYYIGIVVVAIVLIIGGLYYSGMMGAPTKYNLNIQVVGQGTTNPSAGTLSQNSGSMIAVTATPATGWAFSNWQLNGQNSTTNPINVSLSSDVVLKAVFKLVPPPSMSRWSLAIGIEGQGTTTPGKGTTQVTSGSTVAITATPASGWAFDHWVINGQNSAINPLPITLETDYSVTAVFKLSGPPTMSRWSLAIGIQGQGTTSPGPGVTQVTSGSTVAITATPASGWAFDHWVINGQDSATNPLSLTLETDYSVTAVFKLSGPPTMSRWSVGIDVQGQGTTSLGTGITQVTSGSVVTITAIPSSFWVFDHWVINGQNSTNNPLTLTVETDYSVTAVFKLGGPPVMSRWSLAIRAEGGGTTSPAPSVTMVPTDTVITVTAIPDQGKVFDHWVLNGAIVTGNTITFTMTTDYSLTAVFK